MINKKQIGNLGEIDAQIFLKKKKYKILDVNFKTKVGEIDIIAFDTRKSQKQEISRLKKELKKATINEKDLIEKKIIEKKSTMCKNILVFVEVKTRSSHKYGLPREAVGKFKQAKIRSVAEQYVKIKSFYKYIRRFDIVEVEEDINHIENAF